MVANLTTRLGQLTSSPAGGPYTGANKIINGDMAIDQRNAGASVTISTSQYLLDRYYFINSVSSKLAAQQNKNSVAPPAGFTNYIGFTSLSSYSVGAAEYFLLNQAIEGLNCTDLNWGTANAKAVTISFWVYSSLTGTFGGSINNSASNRSYPFTYTISSANTWEQKSVTIAGDTSGTWLTTIGVGLWLRLGLGVGSTYSGTAGSWSGSTYFSATGATSVVGTNGANWYITGVKLEVGSIATPFVPDDYAVSLGKCQRYYEKSFPISTAPAGGLASLINTGSAFVNGALMTYIAFKVTKRAAPTFVGYRGNTVAGTDSQWNFYNAVGAWTNGGTTSPNVINTIGIAVQTNDPGGGGITIPANGSTIVDGNWTADAEL